MVHPASRIAPNKQIAVFKFPVLLEGSAILLHRIRESKRPVDALMEFFADLEKRGSSGRNVNRLACPRVAALPFLSIFDSETPESAYLDTIPLSQCICHVVEDRVYDDLRILEGYI